MVAEYKTQLTDEKFLQQELHELFDAINENLLNQKAHRRMSFLSCGAEDDLNEPLVWLLILVRAVNEENFLVKKAREEIEY